LSISVICNSIIPRIYILYFGFLLRKSVVLYYNVYKCQERQLENIRVVKKVVIEAVIEVVVEIEIVIEKLAIEDPK
jgi:hypothetical protein